MSARERSEGNEPDARVEQDAPLTITRLMMEYFRQREDLQTAFDLSSIRGRCEYVLWWLQDGRKMFAGVDRYWSDEGLAELDSPAPGIEQSTHIPITRFMALIHRVRPDLRENYDLESPRGRFQFLRWWLRKGSAEIRHFKTDLSEEQAQAELTAVDRETQSIPLPPKKLMERVGTTQQELYSNLDRDLIYGSELDEETYARVLDFGCGCGRVARQLLQQIPRPQSYLGIDLHKPAIKWCAKTLSPIDPNFSFIHHDVHNPQLNPKAKRRSKKIVPDDSMFTLVLAHSVFTHIDERDVDFYLRECARVLDPDIGVLRSTWFLFNRQDFPFIQDWQHTLYTNLEDPTAAVVYEKGWLRRAFSEAGLTIVAVHPPKIRGYHWVILAKRARAGDRHAGFPEDTAAVGSVPPTTGPYP